MKRLLLILNPAAGVKRAPRRLSDILNVFNRAGYRTEVYITAGRGDAAEAVRKYGGDMDRIVAAGGDGTLNETVNGLLSAGLDVPLGYIPAGSTNDFAASLKLPADPVKAARRIVEGTETLLDAGRFGDRFFTYVASFGAFTRTSYETPQGVKNALGHTAYLLEGTKELSLMKKERVRMELDGEVFEDDYLFGAVCNSRSVGGILTLAPGVVDMADGKFEVLLLRAPRDLAEVHECLLALSNQTYDCGMIAFRSAASVKVTAPEGLLWSLDGERAEGGGAFRIETLPGRLRLLH